MNTHGLGQGLRERKKRQTYDLIQRTAVRLFQERGYAATTVEDVAAAADVSPSTVFRYFPTKPDLVIMDAWDDQVRKSFAAQPRDLPFHAAFKAAMVEAFSTIGDEDLGFFVARQQLTAAVPELRAAMLDTVIGAAGEIEQLIVDRRIADHPDPARLHADASILAAAAVGVIAVEALSNNPTAFDPKAWPALADRLARLAEGFDL